MPLKVLHLTSTHGGIGGAEKLLLDLSDRYDSSRFSVAYCNVFSRGDIKQQYFEALRERGLPYYKINGEYLKNVPKIVSDLVRLIRRERIDIVHAHLIHACIVAYLAVSLEKISKLVITRHYTVDIPYLYKSFLLAKLDARSAAKANKVIAVSNEVKNGLILQGVSPERIEIIHNGTDLSAFEQTTNTSDDLWKSPKEKIVLATIGSLSPLKGHSTLIKVFAKIAKKIPKINLIIIGEGANRNELENLAKNLQVENKISFLGFRSDVPAILKNTDLYVHPSNYEAFGIAVLEAMAARKCVIATRVGGIPDIIVEGQTGFLVPPSNEDALEEAILYAINNPKQTFEMGEAGRRRVEQNFRIESVAEKYQNLYESFQ